MCLAIALSMAASMVHAGERERLRSFCDKGDAAACNGLGLMWSEGEDGPQDKAKARGLHEKACEWGCAGGCFNLGVAWEKGVGGQQSKVKARELYKKACDGGVTPGCLLWAQKEREAQEEKKVQKQIPPTSETPIH